MDDRENYCEAEIDRIACYEEKKLLIQNAEERCDNLLNQFDYLRVLQTHCSYHEKQDEKLNAVQTNSSKEEEYNICNSSEIPIVHGVNQMHSKYRSPLTLPTEEYVTLEDGYMDDGVSGGLDMLYNTDKDELDKYFDSTKLHDKPMSSQFNSTYSDNNFQDNFTLNKTFDGDFNDRLVSGICDDNIILKGERDEIKECETSENLRTGNRRERRVMFEKATKKSSEQLSLKQPNKPLDNVKHKPSPRTRVRNQIKRSNMNEYLENYKRPPLKTSSIISVSTVPTSNFKKEKVRNLPNNEVHKLRSVRNNAEESNESNPEDEIKFPSQNLRTRDSQQNPCNEKMIANHFRRSKTGSLPKGNLDDKEHGQYTAAKSKKEFPRNVITEANTRQGTSKPWRAVWTERANGLGQLGQQTRNHSNQNPQSISVHIVKKTVNLSPNTAKKKSRLFCSENRELDNHTSKVLRNGFGLHTISSKLKMSEKMNHQKNCSKYPFVVGKATTPSHNLVLNIQQTLSIIKLKPQPVNSQVTASGTIECQNFPSIITTDDLMGSTLRMDPVMFVETRSSISGIQNCPLINQSSIATCIIQNEFMETHDWYLFQEKYGDASVNKCQCYPRKCTNYHKVINQYLKNEGEIQFLHENDGSYDQSKKLRQIDMSQGETIRERLTQILRKVQTFQCMLTSKQGV